MNNWNNYIKNTKGSPRPLLVEALLHATKGRAIDLGCGAGNDTRFLENAGFSVTAVDSSEAVKEYVPNAVISTIEDFDFPLDCHVINASFSLPFIPPAHIDRVVEQIKAALTIHGIFVGQFFGTEDTWANRHEMSFHTSLQIRRYFEDFRIIKLEEKKYEKNTALGDSHFWHIYNVIVSKK